ncbi:hypothetical protein B0H16DRAFT_1743612 [Mycena metata]|uniref:Uncharacterized protein n=1 Tax=Mycena metata TaxID=1033252 RepID=A0AAD7ME79_9AGAR|nr:hypothetical protein B0H16DRAFT_1743612 [Mycena metata]
MVFLNGEQVAYPSGPSSTRGSAGISSQGLNRLSSSASRLQPWEPGQMLLTALLKVAGIDPKQFYDNTEFQSGVRDVFGMY